MPTPSLSPPNPAPAVIIADDAAAVRDLLRAALRPSGFSVLEAASGPEALAEYRRHRGAVRLVILDVRMPGLDGPRTLAALRRLDPGVCCWFVSGVLAPGDERELLAQGAARVFPKPLPLAAFLDAVCGLEWPARPAV
jgi:two-component system, OmpR family, response regulator